MDALLELLLQKAPVAHWYIFFAILLAGMNIPISVDVVILIGAVLSATVIPENTLLLYLVSLIGCYLSAMIAYWIGRVGGAKLTKFAFFSKIISQERLEKVRHFYQMHGLLTLLLGRFIPFGVRNCIFMSTGICKMSFKQFIKRDALACTVWCSSIFFLFYSLGANYQVLLQYLKKANLLLFFAFSVTVIVIIWYKRRKNSQSDNRELS
jgi:membrane-associated protein